MKDKKQGGYGKEKVRLGKDAVKGFDCCSLTLQPTKTPCITPQVSNTNWRKGIIAELV